VTRASAPLRYRIAPLDPRAHVFRVSCTLPIVNAGKLVFRMPTWAPGSYLIREFARNVIGARARDDKGPVAAIKIAKDAWQIPGGAGSVTFETDVYAFDNSVRAAYLDTHRGFFNGPAVFVCPEGFESSACELELVAPADDAPTDWRVATSMPRANAPADGFGTYVTANYDELIDHPVAMGRFDGVEFSAGQARHRIVVFGRHSGRLDRLASDLQRVCQAQTELFGAPGSAAPIEAYLFQLLVLDEGYGGLEHRASTSLVCSRNDLPTDRTGTAPDDLYRNLLGLASHEYFHLWNVKRIKPSAFMPYDLSREAYTRQLWAFEGITSYYDDLMLLRSGVLDRASYLELLGRTLTAVRRSPASDVQSVADSSFDAWIKYYRRDENAPNAVTSYYLKGSLVALALDLTLRSGGSSLDDLIRALWQRYGLARIGVPENGVEQLANELSGRDQRAFFRDFVDGVAELPLDALLADFGIRCRWRVADSDGDRGGKPASGTPPRVWTGWRTTAAGSELRIAHVLSNSPAERAGLAPGDVLVAIDGLRASSDGVRRACASYRPGDVLQVDAFRRDELLHVALHLEAPAEDTAWLEIDAGCDEAARARRDAWLGASG
jgi:predicted metalloprotease with PDZ domain